MKHSFLEPRLLFVNAPATAPEAVASSSSQDSTPDTTPATQADVAKMIKEAMQKPAANEDKKPTTEKPETNVSQFPKIKPSDTLGGKIEGKDAANDKNANLSFPYRVNQYGGISNLLFKKEEHGKKLVAEALISFGFAPYAVYNLIRGAIGATGIITTSQPIKSISKGVWQRTKQTVGTVWEKGIKKPFLRTKNFAALTAQGAANTAGFGIGGIVGGTAWGIKNLLKGVQYLTTKPLAWAGSTLSSLPFYVGDIIESTTKALDNIFGAVQTPFRNVDNFFFDFKATKEGKASRMMQAFHIMGHNPATVIDDMKAQLAELALLNPTLAAAIIQGEKGFANTKQKLDGVVNEVRDSSILQTFKKTIFSTAKRKAV